MVRTMVQTPRFCGAPLSWRILRCFIELNVYLSAGALLFDFFSSRPFRTSWLIVGTLASNHLQTDFSIFKAIVIA
jgi:hypothetical protein